MRILILVFLVITQFACGDDSKNSDSPTPPVEVAIRAADVSLLPVIEAYPTTFLDTDGAEKSVLEILKENGCNTIRIRLWHTPENEHSGFEEVKEFVTRVRAEGFDVWLTVHYSDTWADPGHQEKPAAWAALNSDDLADSVYNYTKKIVTQLQPDIIQIGNEINDGFLWPDGRLSVSVANFATLLKAAVQAVRDHEPTAKIMMHYAGHDAQWFYQHLLSQNVSYDLIGLS